MTIKELQERIDKKKGQIAKIERSIKRLEQNDPYGDLRYRQRDLEEAQATLAKYETQLNKQINYENETKIETIWNFLQQWKANAYNFFVENAKLYHELISNYEIAKEEAIKNGEYDWLKERCSGWKLDYEIRRRFEEEYYKDIHSMTKNLYRYGGKVDEQKLEKFLNAEVDAKYKNLVKRITEKAGEIIDANGLYIARNGEINGLVKGSKRSVKVETIGAGGYNIQIFHFRTLVK